MALWFMLKRNKDGPADLPRSEPSVAMPTVDGSTFTVASGANLQTEINSAAAADGNLTHEVVLEAGATWTGNYNLPLKSGSNPSGTGWIIIRSAGTLPAVGTRITAASVAQMATLSVSTDVASISTATSAHHYRFIGIEVKRTGAVQHTSSLILFGKSSGQTVANMAHHLILDRCYVHGEAGVDTKRGLFLNSAEAAVVNCLFNEIHYNTGTPSDSQAILGFNGSGPYLIQNNRLEAESENVQFGGADPTITGLIPSDITIRGNHLTKDTAWINDAAFVQVKNLFELKIGIRVLFENNVLNNVWNAADQRGQVFNLKTEDQSGGAAWSETSHVTIRYNKCYNANSFMTIGSQAASGPGVPLHSISVHDNLAYDIGDYGGFDVGIMFQLFSVPASGWPLANISIKNNTVVANSAAGTYSIGINIIGTDAPDSARLVFENNILSMLTNGMDASGFTAGTASIAAQWIASYSVTGNVLIGSYTTGDYPSGNTQAADIAAVGFTNAGSDDYSLAGGSVALTSGVGGAYSGANIPAVLASTSGVV